MFTVRSFVRTFKNKKFRKYLVATGHKQTRLRRASNEVYSMRLCNTRWVQYDTNPCFTEQIK